MGLFGGLPAFAIGTPAAQRPAPAQVVAPQPVERRGLFGARGPNINWGAIGDFLVNGTDGLASRPARQREEQDRLAQIALADRVRAQLSPADTAAGSGTGALPTYEQSQAALNDARLLGVDTTPFEGVVNNRMRQDTAGNLFGDDPRAQMLYRAGNQEFLDSLGKGYTPMAASAGTGIFVNGSRVNEQPGYVQNGNTVIQTNSQGAAPVYTRTEPTYDELTKRIEANTVNVAQGGQVYRDGQLYAQNTMPRPISDADQKAIATAEGQIASLDGAINRANGLISMIDGGKLNLGPMTNAISGGLNAIGQSTDNSRAYADLQQWARQARDALLQANTGVQTDQDAVRALDNILAGVNDERLVKQYLQQYVTATSATRDVLARDIQRRNGSGQQGGGSGRVYVNPQTGQRIRWNGSQWVSVQ